MALAPGDRVGPYEVVAPLGTGAMGEVYRAHDARLKRDGALKVLDFGLARALHEEAPPVDANSPTRLGPRTDIGMLLGTAPYMSPEQARGRAVDKRTDIWAFGAVLYELLTGVPAFAGES